MLNLATLPVGARVRLKDGGAAEVVENPEDGMWVLVRHLGGGAEPKDTEELVHADQVVSAE